MLVRCARRGVWSWVKWTCLEGHVALNRRRANCLSNVLSAGVNTRLFSCRSHRPVASGKSVAMKWKCDTGIIPKRCESSKPCARAHAVYWASCVRVVVFCKRSTRSLWVGADRPGCYCLGVGNAPEWSGFSPRPSVHRLAQHSDTQVCGRILRFK